MLFSSSTTGPRATRTRPSPTDSAAWSGRARRATSRSGSPATSTWPTSIRRSGACGMAALSLAELGDGEGALRAVERGHAVAEAADHLYSLAAVGVARAYVLGRLGRAAEAVAVAEPVVATCREKRFAGQFMLGACALADAYAALGRGADAVRLAGEAIALQESVEALSDRSYMHSVKAFGHLAAGELDAADADVARALAIAERSGERGWEAWAHYAGGLAAQRRG